MTASHGPKTARVSVPRRARDQAGNRAQQTGQLEFPTRADSFGAMALGSTRALVNWTCTDKGPTCVCLG
eukprot:2797558-Heterocapsa_arctica.AAC.1